MTLENGSRIGITTTTGTAARGQSVNCLVIDEMAFIEPHFVEEFWKSVFPIINSARISNKKNWSGFGVLITFPEYPIKQFIFAFFFSPS